MSSFNIFNLYLRTDMKVILHSAKFEKKILVSLVHKKYNNVSLKKKTCYILPKIFLKSIKFGFKCFIQ